MPALLPRLRKMTCPECQAELIRTSVQYLCCPNGHGKLIGNFDYNGRVMGEKHEWTAKLKRFDRDLKKWTDYLKKPQRKPAPAEGFGL